MVVSRWAETLGILLSAAWWVALVGAFALFVILAVKRLARRDAEAEALDDEPLESPLVEDVDPDS